MSKKIVPSLTVSYRAAMKYCNALLMLCLVFGLAGCSSQPAPEKSISLKLMSYNIRVGKGGGPWNDDSSKADLEPVAKVIESHQPDIVGLQEVDRNRKRTGKKDQPGELSSRLGMHSAFQPSFSISVPGGDDEEYGNALLSRFPINSSERFLLFKPDYSKTNPKYPNYYSEQRSVLYSTVSVEGTTVHVFATHLGLTADQREQQVDQILEMMAKHEGPKVLFGDFNAEPSETAMQRLASKYTDVFKAVGASDEDRKSFPAGLNPKGAIDYIFVSSEFEVLSAEVIRDASLASDHNPVIATVRLKKSAK